MLSAFAHYSGGGGGVLNAALQMMNLCRVLYDHVTGSGLRSSLYGAGTAASGCSSSSSSSDADAKQFKAYEEALDKLFIRTSALLVLELCGVRPTGSGKKFDAEKVGKVVSGGKNEMVKLIQQLGVA